MFPMSQPVETALSAFLKTHLHNVAQLKPVCCGDAEEEPTQGIRQNGFLIRHADLCGDHRL